MNNEELKLLQAIASDVSGLKSDVSGLKNDMAELKEDVTELKSDVSGLKSDMAELKGTVQKMDTRLTRVELTLENDVSKSIKLLVEGHQGLVDRLWHVPDEIEEIKESVSILDFVQKQMAKNNRK